MPHGPSIPRRRRMRMTIPPRSRSGMVSPGRGPAFIFRTTRPSGGRPYNANFGPILLLSNSRSSHDAGSGSCPRSKAAILPHISRDVLCGTVERLQGCHSVLSCRFPGRPLPSEVAVRMRQHGPAVRRTDFGVLAHVPQDCFVDPFDIAVILCYGSACGTCSKRRCLMISTYLSGLRYR